MHVGRVIFAFQLRTQFVIQLKLLIKNLKSKIDK